ncbi:hypothetical protein CIG75_13325 [Tumebacillus algifaecis]|uniref:Uncharacterized protein n=1 Tax=Tumebacillus algifaecis TaxID=1214604 RepID=A0A223D2I1_9BACL|nr:hypothetical protein CIG75_13325 [Tumebacillus algifaecis]
MAHQGIEQLVFRLRCKGSDRCEVTIWQKDRRSMQSHKHSIRKQNESLGELHTHLPTEKP